MSLETQEAAAEIKAFVAERNAMLLRGDIGEMREFMLKYNPDLPQWNDEMARTILHKSITAAIGLPRDYRMASKQWLADRGMSGMEDDLPAATPPKEPQ